MTTTPIGTARQLPRTSDNALLADAGAGTHVELRRIVWRFMSDLHRQGTTVVLTTHYLAEAEELCDRIAIINHGRLIANKPTRELVDMAREKIVAVTTAADLTAAPAHAAFAKVEWDGARGVEVTYDKDRMNAGQVLAILQGQGITVEDVTTREADLEDVFVQLTAGV
jgi:ABC-2 type transport system ATP-binding protein